MLSAQIRYKRLDPNLSLYQTPTQTLYWLNPWIEAGVDRAEIKKVSANAYLKKGDGIYFSRAISEKEWSHLVSYKMSMYYIIDDDYEALGKDESVPEDYKNKMGKFSECVLPRILANPLVKLYAGSKVLAVKYGCEVLNPCWLLPPMGESKKAVSKNCLHIGFLSSASHLGDFQYFLREWLPLLNDCLASIGRKISITHYLRSHIDIRNIPEYPLIELRHEFAMPWPVYRHEIPRIGFDAIVCPRLDTQVNHARSRNKEAEAEMLGLSLFEDPMAFFDWLRAKGIS